MIWYFVWGIIYLFVGCFTFLIASFIEQVSKREEVKIRHLFSDREWALVLMMCMFFWPVVAIIGIPILIVNAIVSNYRDKIGALTVYRKKSE